MPALSVSAKDVINQVSNFANPPMGALQIAAQIVLDVAQSLCPVDTGNLRDSAYMKASGNDVEFGFEAIYASYVEFGTYKMEAQPYLRPAIDGTMGEVEQALADYLNDWIMSGGKSDFSRFEPTATTGGVQTQGNPSGRLQP